MECGKGVMFECCGGLVFENAISASEGICLVRLPVLERTIDSVCIVELCSNWCAIFMTVSSGS